MNIIMHIDVNNAFLSWEALYLMENGYKYDIRNSYAIIGDAETKRKGIVLAKSNSAKKLGIKTGEPIFQAMKKCRVLKAYKPHFQYYYQKSNQMMELIKSYTPDIEITSVDECFIDYTKVSTLYGDYMQFAKRIQKEILDTLGFGVNIGIANNKLCAKMASDLIKPFKINTIFDDEIKIKMYPLPIENLYGIGKATTPKLRSLGIETVGDLAEADESKLKNHFKNQSINMINIAKGIDGSSVVSEKIEVKGISHSTTLDNDTTNLEKLNDVLFYLTSLVCKQLRSEEKYANIVTVFIKTKDFKLKSHQRKMDNSTSNTLEIFYQAKKLLKEINLNTPVRLIGVRVDNLTRNIVCQLSLFEEIKLPKSIDTTVDSLQKKYGDYIINSASIKKI